MIKISNLSKVYSNGYVALENINLEIPKGTVLGVLGVNGSGKTTLMKLIQGYLKPTTGTITIDGKNVGPSTKAKVSYLPDVPFIRKDYKISEAKNLWKTFFEDFNEEKFLNLLEFMGLNENQRIDELSKGMNEKFHLSLVLGRDADIYVIDEPIAGVDLVSRDKILDAIFNNIGDDKTLIITTHLIDEMESLFDEVVFVRNGHIVLKGSAESLREERNMQIADIFRDVFKDAIF